MTVGEVRICRGRPMFVDENVSNVLVGVGCFSMSPFPWYDLLKRTECFYYVMLSVPTSLLTELPWVESLPGTAYVLRFWLSFLRRLPLFLPVLPEYRSCSWLWCRTRLPYPTLRPLLGVRTPTPVEWLPRTQGGLRHQEFGTRRLPIQKLDST